MVEKSSRVLKTTRLSNRISIPTLLLPLTYMRCYLVIIKVPNIYTQTIELAKPHPSVKLNSDHPH